jgi:hypothetical protein
MGDALRALERLLHERLIPEFCSDPRRSCNPRGFRNESFQVSEIDARYFLMGIEAGLIEHRGHGIYRTDISAAPEQFFWEGLRALDPRPFTLWIEPILTVGGLARLHFDYGWPKHLIGTQSSDWAFDLVAFAPEQSTESIAGEVKKTAKEVQQLLDLMGTFGQHPTMTVPASGKARNAFKKVAALRARRCPIFWALGPDGLSEVRQVEYDADDTLRLVAGGESDLTFAESWSAGGVAARE